MFCSHDIQVLYLQPSHDLPDLRRHDEGAFLNIPFEPQLIKSPNLAN